jgi:hypothetical protein
LDFTTAYRKLRDLLRYGHADFVRTWIAMIAASLKAWGVGLVISVVLFGLSAFGTHTPLQLAFLFILPFFVIAAEVSRALRAAPAADLLVNTLTLLLSSGFYGMLAFFVIRRWSRKRDAEKQ